MARPFAVEIDGVRHEVPPTSTVKVLVQDETIERHFTFAGQLEEAIFDAEGDEVDGSTTDYEDVNSLYTASYTEDDDEEEDDLDDEDDEEEEEDDLDDDE